MLEIGKKIRVICEDPDAGGWVGMTGTIIHLDQRYIFVDFGKKSAKGHGHSCDFRIKRNTGWAFPIRGLDEIFVMNNKKPKQLEFSF